MNRSGKIVLYAIFTLAAMVFFLYTLFPSELARDYIVEQLRQAQPDLQMSTERIRPVFPIGLKLTPVMLSYDGATILQTESVTARLVISSLFKERREIEFSGDIGGGTLQGKAEWLPATDREIGKVLVHMIDVNMEELDVLKQWDGFKTAGRMNAYIDFDRRQGGAGIATIQLDIAQAALMLTPPIMGLERVEFNQVQAELNLTQRMLQIKQFEALGPQMQGKVNGSVLFRQPLTSSRVTLSCSLKPEPAFIAEHKNDALGGLLASEAAQKRGLFLRINGTLDNPTYMMR